MGRSGPVPTYAAPVLWGWMDGISTAGELVSARRSARLGAERSITKRKRKSRGTSNLQFIKKILIDQPDTADPRARQGRPPNICSSPHQRANRFST